MKKVKKAIAIAVVCANGLIIYNVFSPKTNQSNQIISKYEAIKSVNMSGVPEDEIFSEEIDCVYIDQMGIKNVTFKQKNFNLN